MPVKPQEVERIGHGIRAVEDPQLVEALAARRIPLEVCPISNLCTAVVNSITEHPIRRLFERGVIVTVNTDDPQMFGNSLALEYATLVDRLNFSPLEIRQLILQAVQSSWLEQDEKDKKIAEFKNDPDWQ
jgi:adenosine deaminase